MLLTTTEDYIVQTYRFAIFEEIGCVSTAYTSGLSILLLNVPILLFSLTSLVFYSRSYIPTFLRRQHMLILIARLIILYFKHRKELDDTLRSVSNGEMSSRTFSKILAIGLFDIILTLPCGVLILINELLLSKGVRSFWPGWRDVHMSTQQVITATTEQWKALGFWEMFSMRFSQINTVVYGIAFFALFGLTEGKWAQYKKICWTIMKALGVEPSEDPKVEASIITFANVPATCSGTIELRDAAVKT